MGILPIRDAEFAHDPSATARLQEGALVRDSKIRNLRFALDNFREDELADVLGKTLQDVLGNSKARAFNVLDAARDEVMK